MARLGWVVVQKHHHATPPWTIQHNLPGPQTCDGPASFLGVFRAMVNTISLWLRAVRPGFLLVTAVAVALGTSQALACGCGWDPWGGAAALCLALLTHAAVNLYNDYGDSHIGSDAINTEHISPFSGGSRLIQEGRLTPQQVQQAAGMLALVVAGGGVLLAARVGPGLLLVGMAGVALGWSYSHPRWALMSRGWGELAVVAGWWLVVVGADLVQRHQFSAMAAVSGVSLALLVAGILWAAEFPDARADAAAGKHTLVVRWGARPAAIAYAGGVLLAHGWVWAWWWAQWLPTTAWWALGSAPLSVAAALLLWQRATQVQRLRPVVVLSVAAALVHGVLLTAAFAAVAALR